MPGVLINSLAIVLGTVFGVLFRRFLPKKLGDAVMTGMALCVIYIGIDGVLEGKNPIISILSVSVGALIGTLLNLDGLLQKLGNFIEKRFVKNKGEKEKTSVSEAFVSSSLLFCVGAMSIVGSLDAGLSGDNNTLYAKAVLDGISAVFYASSLGFGVIFSAVSVLLYQGAIVLLADVLEGVLTNGTVIAEMTSVGSLLIVALGLNMLGITKIKTMNYLPAVFLPILFCLFF